MAVAALLPAGREALREAPAKAQAGFRTFKWKVAVGEARDEMAILDDLVGMLPAGSRVRLDANGGWDVRTAGRWLDHASGRPVEFVEQPVGAGSRGADDALLGLAADYPVPVALDESVACDADAIRWLEAGWRGYFVVKAALFGDAEGTLGRLARAGARVVFSSALETGVGARSALRAAFAWPGERAALGFGVWPLFADSRFDGPAAAPFFRREDVERMNPEALWNAVS
jgi:O-succinylbenzoate synthase